MKKYLLIVTLLVGGLNSSSQQTVNDSIYLEIKKINSPNAKVSYLNKQFFKYEYQNPQKAKKYLDVAVILAKKYKLKSELGDAYINFGYFAEDKGNFHEGLTYFKKALKVQLTQNDQTKIGNAYYSVGSSYYYIGNYPEALKYYFTALKLRLKINDLKGVSDIYLTIGNIYKVQLNRTEANKNYKKALKLKIKIKDEKGLGDIYNNMGINFVDDGLLDKANEFLTKSVMIRIKIKDDAGISTSYLNIGRLYTIKAEMEKNKNLLEEYRLEALQYYFKGLKIAEDISDQLSMVAAYNNIGVGYYELKKYNESKLYLNKAIELSTNMRYFDYVYQAYGALSNLNQATGDFTEAFENLKLFYCYHDSLINEESKKLTLQNQLNYDFEKKEAIAKEAHKQELANQKLLANEKSRKQQLTILLIFIGVSIIVLFAGFIYRSLRKTKKQKIIIERQKIMVESQKHELEIQKEHVEEKQKEVMDSIRYARRIQLALLPSNKYIEKSLNVIRKK